MLLHKPAPWALLALAPLLSAQTLDQLTPHQVKLESVDDIGKRAVKVVEDGQVLNGEASIVKDATFHDGEIEVELAGRPAFLVAMIQFRAHNPSRALVLAV